MRAGGIQTGLALPTLLALLVSGGLNAQTPTVDKSAVCQAAAKQLRTVAPAWLEYQHQYTRPSPSVQKVIAESQQGIFLQNFQPHCETRFQYHAKTYRCFARMKSATGAQLCNDRRFSGTDWKY